MGEWDAFDKWPEDTCYCRCGSVFLSHARVVDSLPCSRTPCPRCGGHALDSFSTRPPLPPNGKEPT